MAISNFPTILQPIIQTGYLERQFDLGLKSKLAFRNSAERQTFATGRGESSTRTKPGLLPVNTTPLNPTVMAQFPANSYTNLDNGLVPVQWGVEQYTMFINEYGTTMNLNTVNETVGIVNQFSYNAYALGENAARTLDELARNALFGAYMAGNTRVRVASSGTSVAVDDIRGFTAASQAAPLAIVIGAGQYSVIGAVPDVANASSIMASGGFSGVSGVLTLASAVSAADGAVNAPVNSGTAAVVVRPNGRASTSALTGADTLTMATILDAKAKLESNAVPRINGFYDLYLDPTSSRELFSDPDFKVLFQGATNENTAYRMGVLSDPFLGVRFVPTTEAILQASPSLAGATVHRPIMVGAGALIEGDFAGQNHHDTETSVGEFSTVDGVTMVTREPLDRLQQNIAQSWYWIGGFCAPTDTSVNSSIVATASNAAFKRAVILEHI